MYIAWYVFYYIAIDTAEGARGVGGRPPRGPVGEGPPAEGPPPPPPWGPGEGARRGARGGSPKRLHKAPTDYTKPQQTIQSPGNTIQSPGKTIQRHEILDKTLKY